MYKTWAYLLVGVVVVLMGSGVGLVLTSLTGSSQVQISDAKLSATTQLKVGGNNIYQIECDAGCRRALLNN